MSYYHSKLSSQNNVPRYRTWPHEQVFSTNKLEIVLETLSTDPTNIIHCRHGPPTTAINFHFQCLEQHVRSAQPHLDVYKNKVSWKIWLSFFLEALEVWALKPKYEMEYVNHKIQITLLTKTIHPNLSDFSELKLPQRKALN